MNQHQTTILAESAIGKARDPIKADIFDLIKLEEQRQNECIELIASENFVSDRVLRAQGSRTKPLNAALGVIRAKGKLYGPGI